MNTERRGSRAHVCEIWGPFPQLLPMGGEATQSQPEVWPSCVSSLPGARREHLLAWLTGLGPPGGTAQWLYLLSWELCMEGTALQHLNVTLGSSAPFRVPSGNACALARGPACTGTAQCGMGARKQARPSLPSWPSEAGDGGKGLAACGTPHIPLSPCRPTRGLLLLLGAAPRRGPAC